MAKIDFNDPHGKGIQKRRDARSSLLFGFIILIVGLFANGEWHSILIIIGIILIIRSIFLKFIYKE